jgi:hypothetical protein
MLLFPGYAAWGRLHWQRLILIEERRQELPALEGEVPGNSLGLGAKALDDTLQLSVSIRGHFWGRRWRV